MNRSEADDARSPTQGERASGILAAESRWRLSIFRLLLPVGILVCIEQLFLSTAPSQRITPWLSGGLLLVLWVLSWHPKIAASSWIAPVGDTLIVAASLIGGVVGSLGVFAFNDRASVAPLQGLALWMPILTLYVSLVLSEHRLWLLAFAVVMGGTLVMIHLYTMSQWGEPVLTASIGTFVGQVAIASGTAMIFSRYRSSLSHTVARLQIAEAQSMTDSLTRLPNRRSFLHDARTRWSGEPEVSLLVLDLDEFKRVNDTLGHHAGDQVLATFADAVKRWLPGGVRIYRWGGEEFAVSLSLPQIAATAVAEQLCEHVSALTLPFGVRITASIGGSVFATTESVESAFQRADQALYDAKRQGRNRVVFREI